MNFRSLTPRVREALRQLASGPQDMRDDALLQQINDEMKKLSVEEIAPRRGRPLLDADSARAAAWNEGRFEDFLPAHDADDLRANMVRTVRAIGLAHLGQRVVAASHGGASNTFLAEVVGSSRRFFFNPGYTSISRLQVHPDGRFVLMSINETAHLDTPSP